jgi:hypothetical protein
MGDGTVLSVENVFDEVQVEPVACSAGVNSK